MGKINLSLFVDSMILCLKTKDSSKKKNPLDQINTFIKVPGYRSNIKKLVVIGMVVVVHTFNPSIGEK